MALRSLRSLAVRAGLAGFALGAALVALGAAGGVAGAQGISGFNSDAPVNYAADRIELQDKQQRVVLSGNVEIAQGDLGCAPPGPRSLITMPDRSRSSGSMPLAGWW